VDKEVISLPIPGKLEVSWSINGWEATSYEEGAPYVFTLYKSDLSEFEDVLNRGESEPEFWVSDSLMQGAEAPYILPELKRMGITVPDELLNAAKKFIEEDTISDEDYDKIREFVQRYSDRLFKWTWKLEQIKWGPEAQMAREVAKRKYTYEELIALPRTTAGDKQATLTGRVIGLDAIAMYKGISSTGKKEDVARKIYQHDYMGQELDTKMKDIDEMLKKLGGT